MIDQAGIDPVLVDVMVHGTTVVINALIERKAVKVGLITTKGLRDSLAIARGNRPDFFKLFYERPKPFVPRYLRRELPERMTNLGAVHAELDLSDLPGIVADFKADGVQAVAISFLHFYANPAHEVAALAELRQLWPEVASIAAHQIAREWCEYERTNTAVLSAYVQPAVERYLRRLDAGFWGAADLGKLIGVRQVLALDIGGATAKCALIEDGAVKIMTDYWIERDPTSAGYPIMAPVVDLVEIGNGGGSIAWVEDFDKLQVGPRSAGAVPGPAAYGRGGVKATTTDANLWLDQKNGDYFCGGSIVADMAAGGTAIADVGARLGVTTEEAVRGVIRIANNNMVNTLKLVSLNRGFDPRDFTFVAFGGGGGMHPVALAQELGIGHVVVPFGASVFSAWGMMMSDHRPPIHDHRTADRRLGGAGRGERQFGHFLRLSWRNLQLQFRDQRGPQWRVREPDGAEYRPRERRRIHWRAGHHHGLPCPRGERVPDCGIHPVKVSGLGDAGGNEGSPNLIEFIPKTGVPTRYAFVSGLPTQTGDVIRVMAGNGGGYGDLKKRDPARISMDVKNGPLTADRAKEVYGYDA